MSRSDATRIIAVAALALAIMASFVAVYSLKGRNEAREAGNSAAAGDGGGGGGEDMGHIHFLAFEVGGAKRMLVGAHNGLSVTGDGGRTWSSMGLDGKDTMSVAMNSRDPRSMVVGGHLVFVRTRDGGATWESIGKGLPSLDIHGLAGSWSDPDTLYAYVVDGGLFVSQDGGTSWKATGSNPPSDHIMSLAVNPGDPQVVYAGDMERGIYRSTDGGNTWVETASIGDKRIMALEVDPRNPDTLYAATPAGVYVGRDRGDKWTLPAGWPAGTGATGLSNNPNEPGTLYALKDSGGLLISRDGGESWTSVN